MQVVYISQSCQNPICQIAVLELVNPASKRDPYLDRLKVNYITIIEILE